VRSPKQTKAKVIELYLKKELEEGRVESWNLTDGGWEKSMITLIDKKKKQEKKK